MTKLDTLAYRLKDLETLRNLFSELNFDFEDGPVSKDGWTDYQKSIVRESKIIASKSDYRIYYIQTDTDSIKQWKDISAKIIKANNGFAMVCSHNPGGIKWVFSSLAKEFSKSFSETRHIPIDIRDDAGIPKTFVEFLAKIRVGDDATASSIMSQMSEAFDSFAIQIHDELTVNVFEALKSISEGIILDKSNGLALDEPTLDEIREPTFILLYRIMFVLYAEDRSVFPDSEYYYDNFSLKWIKQEWILNDAAKIDQHEVQNRLRKLFRLIEVGSEELDYKKEKFFMRSYYGRLFDRKIHHQLEKWNIPNENLLKAIDLLTRTRDRKGNYFFLDYAALETRHLGAIYEHLLEFHLTIKDGKVADLPNPKERKSTGSYYTPKYIVDYIVENTVGPLIDNIVKDTSDSGEQIDKILALNVLDPAMGSGHFLVGVTNYIAKRICLIEYGEKDTTEHAFVERKRDVARRCIYGVDINPLAVDLAQVSLWLETLSSERPLSFLSAHLKTGNSLIGSSISDILDKQTTIVEATTGRDQFKKNIRDFIMLEMLDDDTPEAVRAKSVKYSGMQSKGTFYHDLKFLLDAKIAKDFGVDVPPIGDFVAKIGQNSLDFFAKGSSWPEVQRVSVEHSFFHWDLEFPDIFYNEDGKRKKNPGFDGVVGNPPYLNIRDFTTTSIVKEFITTRFMDSIIGQWDLMIPFIHLGLILLRQEGNFSMIVKDTIGISDYTTKIIELIEQNYFLYQIDFFPNVKVFPNVGVNNKILFVKKIKMNNGQISRILHNPTIMDLHMLPYNPNHNKYIESYSDFVINTNKTICLGMICYCSYGLRPNNRKNEPKFKKQDVLSKNHTFKHCRKYVEGKLVERYIITKDLFIEWNTKRVPDKCYRTIRELYNPEKLLMARQKRVVAYSNERHICDATIVMGVRFCDLHGIHNNNIKKYFMNMHANNRGIHRELLEKKSKKFSLKYILVILNSNLIRYFLRHNSVGRIDSTPDDWKQIPIKEITLHEQEKFIKAANEILDLQKMNQLTTNNQDRHKKLLHEKNKEINQLVYDLYGLTKDEIQIVEKS